MAWKRKQAPSGGRSSFYKGRTASVVLRHGRDDKPTLDQWQGAVVERDTGGVRWTAKRQQTLEQSIDNIICYLCLSDEMQAVPKKALHSSEVRPVSFPEPECLMVSHLPGRSSDELMFFADVAPRDVPCRFDVSTCVEKSFASEDGSDRSAFLLHRLRGVSVRKARGKKLLSPYVAEFSQCCVWLDGCGFTGAKWLLNWSGGKWVDLSRTSPEMGQEEFTVSESLCPEIDDFNYRVLMGVEFTRDLIWRVVLHSQAGVSISLPTGYSGAMAAFRNRDANEITGRRDALRHWVKEHYRLRPDTGEKDIAVRQHLRGRQPFRWLGLDCELVVAPFDERYNQRLADEKAAARKARGYEPLA